ncbi:uncharacterized protein LOC109608652 [Aethina tumida]|uniref:uncharacterized protein LOC109608652 n=1 Tax=Aethina tumida TaxID=116153 RepID=UPI00096B569F|nr:uncharacterized protein LOC109608652 [Aethina tumida]
MRNMLSTCVFFIGLVGVLAPPPPIPPFIALLDGEEGVAACITSSGVKQSELEAIKPFEENKVSENVQCFFKCMAEKRKMLNEDGSINIDEFNKRPKPPKVNEEFEKKIEECIKKVKISSCADMEQIADCFKH